MSKVCSPDDTMAVTIEKMSQSEDGRHNPGAITVLMRMLNEGEKIDPDCMSSVLTIWALDELEIRSGKIWLLYKDICGENLTVFLAVLRSVQLGILSKEDLKASISQEQHRRAEFLLKKLGMSVNDLILKIRETCPNFGPDFGKENKDG